MFPAAGFSLQKLKKAALLFRAQYLALVPEIFYTELLLVTLEFNYFFFDLVDFLGSRLFLTDLSQELISQSPNFLT